MTPIGLGRRPAKMRAVAEITGVTVIAASGFHRDAHYPAGHWVYDAPVEVLADRIVADLTRGMHPADWNDPGLPLDRARAGAIKGGASYHHVSPAERRRLEAIAGASAATGAAILVHTEIGTSAHDIVDLLVASGAAVDRIALAHLDRNPDWELHAEVAARGRHARVRHDRPDEVPPGLGGAGPRSSGSPGRGTWTAWSSAWTWVRATTSARTAAGPGSDT